MVFGRRRAGKTRLLTHWLKPQNGLYSQAIEAASGIQIEQVMRDIGASLKTNIAPKNWSEFLELLGLEKERRIVCLDEFPYLVASDPSLPSMIQRWLDHQRPKQFTFVLSGSSASAMNEYFLNRAAPLYQRARKLLHVEPMSYLAFCDACGIKSDAMESFTRFALVGAFRNTGSSSSRAPRRWISRRNCSLGVRRFWKMNRGAFCGMKTSRG